MEFASDARGDFSTSYNDNLNKFRAEFAKDWIELIVHLIPSSTSRKNSGRCFGHSRAVTATGASPVRADRPIPLEGIDMSGWRPLIKGYFAVTR